MKKGFLLCFLYFTVISVFAQEPESISRSLIVEEYNGIRYYIHFVKQGQTLYSIAKAYDVTVDEIKKANPDIAEDELGQNQVLKVPYIEKEKKEGAKPDTASYIYHSVRKRETLYGLSKMYNVSMDKIKQANPSIIQRGLLEGQVVRIPSEKPVSDQVKKEHESSEGQKREEETKHPEVYQVQPGETLYYLSKKFNVTMEELIALNPDLKNGTIAFQEIRLPGRKISYKGMIKIQKDSVVYYINHKVRRKETLYSISRRYHVTLDDLFLLNPVLEEGVSKRQIIKIPVQKTGNYDDIQSGHLIVYSYKQEQKDSLEIEEDKCNPEKYRGQLLEVGLLLPFYLDNISTIPGPDSVDVEDIYSYPSLRFIQFYEGALIALDSLREMGANIRFNVYDAGTAEQARKLLLEKSLDGLDLIIGPVYKTSFTIVSGFAKENNIPIINPFTRRRSVTENNPKVFKVHPSLHALLSRAVYFIQERFPEANIIIVRQNPYQMEEEFKTLKRKLESAVTDEMVIPNTRLYSVIIETSIADTSLPDDVILDSLIIENSLVVRKDIEAFLNGSTVFRNSVKEVIFNNDSIEGIVKKSSIVRPNLIFVISENEVFVMDLITRLNALRDSLDIVLFGLPEWENFEIETEYLLNLNFHLLTGSHINPENRNTRNFIRKFYHKYNTYPEPSRYAYDGFDITFNFIRMMMDYGNDLGQCIEGKQLKGIKYNFEFYRNTPEDGFENHSLRIIRYVDYKTVEIKNQRVIF